MNMGLNGAAGQTSQGSSESFIVTMCSNKPLQGNCLSSKGSQVHYASGWLKTGGSKQGSKQPQAKAKKQAGGNSLSVQGAHALGAGAWRRKCQHRAHQYIVHTLANWS